MESSTENAATYSDQPTSSHLIRIAVPGAIAGGLILIAYFLIVKATGYHLQTNLRWINFLLIIPVTIFAINKYVVTATGKTYLEAFSVSIVAATGSYVVLSIFMFIYLLFDTVLMNQLYQMALPGLQLNQLSIFILMIGEGILGGVVISFVILQFFVDRIKKAA